MTPEASAHASFGEKPSHDDRIPVKNMIIDLQNIPFSNAPIAKPGGVPPAVATDVNPSARAVANEDLLRRRYCVIGVSRFDQARDESMNKDWKSKAKGGERASSRSGRSDCAAQRETRRH